MKTRFISGNFIISAILYAKNKYLRENCVTIEEINFYKKILKHEFENRNLDILFLEEVDFETFKFENNLLLLKDGVEISDLEYRYRYILSRDIENIMFDEELLLKFLKDFYSHRLEELNNVKKLELVKEQKNNQ